MQENKTTIVLISDPVALEAVLEVWDDNLGLLVPEDMQITDSDELPSKHSCDIDVTGTYSQKNNEYIA